MSTEESDSRKVLESMDMPSHPFFIEKISQEVNDYFFRLANDLLILTDMNVLNKDEFHSGEWLEVIRQTEEYKEKMKPLIKLDMASYFFEIDSKRRIILRDLEKLKK